MTIEKPGCKIWVNNRLIRPISANDNFFYENEKALPSFSSLQHRNGKQNTIIVSLLSKIIIKDKYHQLIENHYATKVLVFYGIARKLTFYINPPDETMNTRMELVFKEHKTVPGLYKKQKSIILFDYKKLKSSRRGGNGFSPWPNIGKYFSMSPVNYCASKMSIEILIKILKNICE